MEVPFVGPGVLLVSGMPVDVAVGAEQPGEELREGWMRAARGYPDCVSERDGCRQVAVFQSEEVRLVLVSPVEGFSLVDSDVVVNSFELSLLERSRLDPELLEQVRGISA